MLLPVGIWRAGAVCCPTNVEMNIAYVAEILSHLDCKLALYDSTLDIGKMTAGVETRVRSGARLVVVATGVAARLPGCW